MDIAPESGPHGAHILDVLPGLDLELDLAITLRERRLRALHQRIGSLLYPQ